MTPQDQPATKADLDELRKATRADLDELRKTTRADFDETKEELKEMLRGIETSLLRAFHGYAKGVEVRMRRIEADSQNIDAEGKARLEALESRVLELEMRLPPSTKA